MVVLRRDGEVRRRGAAAELTGPTATTLQGRKGRTGSSANVWQNWGYLARLWQAQEDRWRQQQGRLGSERNKLAPQRRFEPTTLRLTPIVLKHSEIADQRWVERGSHRHKRQNSTRAPGQSDLPGWRCSDAAGTPPRTTRSTMTTNKTLPLSHPPSQHTCQSSNQEPSSTGVRRRRNLVSMVHHSSLFGNGKASPIGRQQLGGGRYEPRLLTERLRVRDLFGEPNKSQFELLLPSG